MRCALLHLDDSLLRQPKLQQAVRTRGGPAWSASDIGPALRLWARAATLQEMKARLRAHAPAADGPKLVFAGSGDFHHVSGLLIERALEVCDRPLTILHFDNHPDWMGHAPGRHCGSWVGRAARLQGVARIVTVGVCSQDIGARRARQGDLKLVEEDRLDLYAWTAPDGGDVVRVGDRAWPTISALGEDAFLALLDAAIPTATVYVTIDKDVLQASEAVTNWDQGQASLRFLVRAVERIAGNRKVVGGDVVGDWSAAAYGGDLAARLLKRGEAMLDQPWRRSSPDDAAINQAANLRLLELFDGIAA